LSGDAASRPPLVLRPILTWKPCRYGPVNEK
jgi:hypothetical protein